MTTRREIIAENNELVVEQSQRNQFGNAPLVKMIGMLRLNIFDSNRISTRNANKLKETIEEFDKSSSREANTMRNLTIGMCVIVILQLVMIGIQIYLQINSN